MAEGLSSLFELHLLSGGCLLVPLTLFKFGERDSSAELHDKALFKRGIYLIVLSNSDHDYYVTFGRFKIMRLRYLVATFQ